jgi:acyl-CoA thioester hydrolase
MSEPASSHTFPVRVYYEDTDAGGVVYYANYLKFAERARTEWLRALGCDQSRLAAEEKILFMVRRCAIDFLAPARLDDTLVIETSLKELGKVRMTMRQAIKRLSKPLAVLEVEIACVGDNGRPTAWPASVMNVFSTMIA